MQLLPGRGTEASVGSGAAAERMNWGRVMVLGAGLMLWWVGPRLHLQGCLEVRLRLWGTGLHL